MMEAVSTRNRQNEREVLVSSAQHGDRAAFDALVAPLRAGLLGIAFVRTGDYPEAEDLTQEALLRAWEHICDLRDPSSFVAWIRAILNRACSTWCRRPREWPISLDDQILIDMPADHGLQPSEVIFRRLRDEELRGALRSIPEANRIALIMAVWGDGSYQQIAEFTGVPISTVEGRIHRAKSQLQRRLRHGYSDPFGEPARRWIEPIDKETPK